MAVGNAQAALTAQRQAWPAAMDGIGFTDTAGTAEAEAALAVWQSVALPKASRESESHRVETIEADLKAFDVDVFGLKRGDDFAIGRTNGLVCPEVLPNKWNRNIAFSIFRFLLVELNVADLQRFAFRSRAGLKAHLVAAQKNDRHIQTLRRIIRVHV